MLRVCIVAWSLSIAACISYPEVTTVDETRDASVSPDGSVENISFHQELGADASVDAREDDDGGVVPHPERDAAAPPEADEPADAGDDPSKGKGKGKPPKKKD